ncbi:hypothetical protein JWG44_20470 [Leptospira sp. 201903071]|uniref:hypothetical protein n=1 Tax=Leptospira ainazelensis TaxID=2810034 RepID=UPI001964DD47|nr:hypothetical protein [Leptospira ainazelensis]MBM9502634.1 hypothetical protein [Leptospira ainazelensis]
MSSYGDPLKKSAGVPADFLILGRSVDDTSVRVPTFLSQTEKSPNSTNRKVRAVGTPANPGFPSDHIPPKAFFREFGDPTCYNSSIGLLSEVDQGAL